MYLRTPVERITIGEIIAGNPKAIVIRIKKPKSKVYEDVWLDQILISMTEIAKSESARYLRTPIQHITIGEVIIAEDDMPHLRIKKASTHYFEDVTFDELFSEVIHTIRLSA